MTSYRTARRVAAVEEEETKRLILQRLELITEMRMRRIKRILWRKTRKASTSKTNKTRTKKARESKCTIGRTRRTITISSRVERVAGSFHRLVLVTSHSRPFKIRKWPSLNSRPLHSPVGRTARQLYRTWPSCKVRSTRFNISRFFNCS